RSPRHPDNTDEPGLNESRTRRATVDGPFAGSLRGSLRPRPARYTSPVAETGIAPTIKLSTSVADLPGVGKRRAAALRRLDIATVSDLLRHLPMRYEFEAAEGSIAQLPRDGIGSARGMIVAAQWVPAPGAYARGRKGR